MTTTETNDKDRLRRILLVNVKHVRDYALAASSQHRLGKFKRVSADFISEADHALRVWIVDRVKRHPSIGKTLK